MITGSQQPWNCKNQGCGITNKPHDSQCRLCNKKRNFDLKNFEPDPIPIQAQQKTSPLSQYDWHPLAKAGSSALVGGVGGYFAGSAFAKDSAKNLLGMSPTVFVMMSTLAGAGLLLLAAYFAHKYITGRPGFFASAQPKSKLKYGFDNQKSRRCC